MKGKDDTRGKRPTRGKKVVTLGDTPVRGPQKTNPHTSPPRTLSQSKEGGGEDKEESSSEKESLENVRVEEVDANPIKRQDPPLPLSPALVSTIE